MKKIKNTISLFLVIILAFSTSVIYAKGSRLPKVIIVATGGTIAGSGNSTTTTSYKAGVLSVEQILASVEGIDKIAEIGTSQFLNIGSQNISTKQQLELAVYVDKILSDKSVTGVVITHGTDTMEESSYLLSLLVTSPKPIILVGAMRPSSGLSADGPANLYGAVIAAVSPESVGRGAMVMMNNELILGADVVKFNTLQTNSFQAPNGSIIGRVINDKAKFIYPAFERKYFNSIPTTSQPLAKVAILYGHVDSDPKLVDFLVSEGYKGIVFAGVGHGNSNDATINALASAVKSGVAVVRASRVATGEVNSHGEVDDAKYGFTSSHRLNPSKARVLLQLALIEANGDSKAACKIFDEMKQ